MELTQQHIELLRKASLVAVIAHDWNVCEVEIDGAMVSTYDLHCQFRDAYRTALDAARTPNKETEALAYLERECLISFGHDETARCCHCEGEDEGDRINHAEGCPVVKRLATLRRHLEPQWTSEVPTEEGWYWVEEDNEAATPQCVYVRTNEPVAFIMFVSGRRAQLGHMGGAKWKSIQPPLPAPANQERRT